MRRRIFTAIGLALVLGLCFYSAPALAGGPEPQEAPTLPPPEQMPPVIDGHGTGFIPPEMDLSYLTGQQMPEKFMAGESPVGQPLIFDWRTTPSKVTSVKNQGACGSCYAFASIANIESKILVDGADTLPNPDYSENNAKECNWRELKNYQSPPGTFWCSCSGGNYCMLASLFSQKGVVLESCDPYQASDVGCTDTCPSQKTLLDWSIISGNVVPSASVLKSYIQSHGPVYTTVYVDAGQGFNSSYNGSYTFNYITPSTTGTNHAVMIVGWSNNLPPVSGGSIPADGWIVKNSWGPSWGANGYFYITYGAANIGMYSSFMDGWHDYDSSGSIMYYDDDCWSSSWGYSGSTTAWGLCKFFPTSNTYVSRVEFWTTDITTDVDVYIYDNFDGTTLSTLLCSSLNHSFSEAGYHGVELDSPLAVTSSNDIIAVVKFTNSSYNWPVAADKNGTTETGRTYMSSDGSSWDDLGTHPTSPSDIAIRLRTTTPATIISCNSSGTEINQFIPGGEVYVKGSGLKASTQYKVWIQDDPVKGEDMLASGEDPSGSQQIVTTDASGNFGPTLIWSIPSSATITHHSYDIVVDKQTEGSNTDKLNFASDGIDSTTVVGFNAPVPELPSMILMSTGLAMLGGYVWFRRRSKRSAS